MSRTARRAWLLKLANSVQKELAKRLSEDIWLPGKPLSHNCVETNSDGWLVELGAVRRDRGSQLELWLDYWTGADQPKLSYCYRSASADRVRQLAKAGTGSLGVARSFNNSYAARSDGSGFSVMKHPLDKSLFGRTIVELTDRPGYWSFLGVYESRSPVLNSVPPSALSSRVSKFLAEVALASSALSLKLESERPFPEERNRKYVRQHLASERDSVLARRVKLRDGYMCRVCNLNFENRYGAIGRQFAEAHHVRQLGRSQEGTRIVAEDLITVCANCHRMLHRMPGARNDWNKLKKIVKRSANRGGP